MQLSHTKSWMYIYRSIWDVFVFLSKYVFWFISNNLLDLYAPATILWPLQYFGQQGWTISTDGPTVFQICPNIDLFILKENKQTVRYSWLTVTSLNYFIQPELILSNVYIYIYFILILCFVLKLHFLKRALRPNLPTDWFDQLWNCIEHLITYNYLWNNNKR